MNPHHLPEAFVARMREQLGGEADAFFASYEQPRTHGLRINPLKLDKGHPMREELIRLFSLRPVPWCGDGFFCGDEARPGKHPYYYTGIYYIQDPSAMLPAELLEAGPGDIVLDLAAAPGGKSTQIAGHLGGRGLLVANDPDPERAMVLSENIERLGVVNAIVTSAYPGDLRRRFPEAFDRVLLDAPCSGEGMFRKDPSIIRMWSPKMVRNCAAKQRALLHDAAAMVKPGGRLVYSTCTFNCEENEENVAAFLREHPEFRLLKEVRLWPHRGEGEGHYAAVLVKGEEAAGDRGSGSAATVEPAGDVLRAAIHPARRSGGRTGGGPAPRTARRAQADRAALEALEAFHRFAAEALPGFRLPEDGAPLLFGEALYWLPQPLPGWPDAADLAGLRVLRPGLHLGQWRKGRFEPGHALALACHGSVAAWTMHGQPGDPAVEHYLRGESLPDPEGRRGWGLATVSGWPVGWLKASDGLQKNRLPKGLRRQI